MSVVVASLKERIAMWENIHEYRVPVNALRWKTEASVCYLRAVLNARRKPPCCGPPRRTPLPQTTEVKQAPETTFQPYIPPEQAPAEFTPRAVILGGFFGLLFGAVTVYVGLRAGLTVAASIPIAVLSISILRAFGRSSILENNIVQTTGNAGQSIASGVIFTLPALVFLGFELEYARIFMLALIGGWLGV